MGGSDCELLGDGWLAQPANAWSSAAYLAAAAYVLARWASADRRPSVPLAGALALALVAVGSFAYHGPQPGWATAAHDASISALLVMVLLHATGTGLRRLGLLVLVLAVGPVVVAPGLDLIVNGVLAFTVGAVELRRRRRRTIPPSAAGRVAAVALALGSVLFVLGRTGAPLCTPTSPVQPHAGWHVATAVAAAAALGRRGPADVPTASASGPNALDE